MTWWIVDNIVLVCVLILPVLLGFTLFWWTTRNSKLLIGVATSAGLMIVALLLWMFVVTDRQQLVYNVEAMAELFNAGKVDEFLQHFDDEVRIGVMQGEQVLKRSDLHMLTKGNATRYGVDKVVVNVIRVREVARPKADVTFFVGPEDSTARGLCRVGFVLSSDGKWRVNAFSVEQVGSGLKSNTPLLFPIRK